DLVGGGDGGDALGDDDRGRATGVAVQALADQRVGGDVERGEGVVEDIHPRRGDQGAGDAQALALPAGDVGAALGDGGFQARRGALALAGGAPPDELGALGDVEGAPQLLVVGRRVAEAEVVRDGAGEQVRL